MEAAYELAQHGSFSYFLALTVTVLAVLVRVFLMPDIEPMWFYILLAVALIIVASLPNGVHWMFDVKHIDLSAVRQGKLQFPYSVLFFIDLIATLLGAATGLIGWFALRRRSHS